MVFYAGFQGRKAPDKRNPSRRIRCLLVTDRSLPLRVSSRLIHFAGAHPIVAVGSVALSFKYFVVGFIRDSRDLIINAEELFRVLFVEYGITDSVETRVSFFLLSDPSNISNSDNQYMYEKYHHQSLSREDIDKIASLPYITSVSRRYLTAGVSPEYLRLDTDYDYFNYSARAVIEATLERVDSDTESRASALTSDRWSNTKSYDLFLSDIKMLAGNEEWLIYPTNVTVDGQMYLRAPTVSPDYFETRMIPVIAYQVPILTGVSPELIGDYGGETRRYAVQYSKNLLNVETVQGLVPGERYVIAARVEPGLSNLKAFHFITGDDTLYEWWPYIYHVTDENYLETGECAPLRELIQVTNDDLHTFDVVYTDDMRSIRRVRDERLLISEGRLLTPEDEGKNVCVVSDAFLQENGLALGDTVNLRLGDYLMEQYAPLGAVASTRGRYAESFTDAEFEIVGAYADINAGKMCDVDLFWSYSDSTIFVPTSFLPADPTGHEFKPGEVSFVIDDAQNIRAFAEECIPLLQEMGLTVYFSDGGWLSVEEQISQAGTLSMSKLLAFTAAAILASALTVYLFIVRKKREYAVMRALGTTKRRSAMSLLLPLMVVTLTAMILGSVAAAVYAGETAEKSLKAFSDLGLAVDSSIPVPVVALGTLGGLALITLLAMFGLYRVGSRPPMQLLQENTNRNAKR